MRHKRYKKDHALAYGHIPGYAVFDRESDKQVTEWTAYPADARDAARMLNKKNKTRKSPRYFARLDPDHGTLWQVVDRERFDRRDFAEVVGCAGHRAAKRKARQLNKEVQSGSDRESEADRGDPQASKGADALGAVIRSQQAAIAASTSVNQTSRYPAFYTYPPSVTIGSYISHPTPLPELPGAPLETVHEDMPILAHRAARLIASRYGLRFKALNDSFGDFGVDADAQCMSAAMTQIAGPHRTPHVDCSCGFYALPADVSAPHELFTVDLLVELSGTVIEHELGYRAEHQRVVECRLPRCPYDGRPVEFAWFVNGIMTMFGCRLHYGEGLLTAGLPPNGPVLVTRADLEAGIPVPVSDEEIP